MADTEPLRLRFDAFELDDAVQADFAALKDARARLQEGSDLALVTKADRLLRVPLR